MADIWMDVDTALARVPVNMVPLVDDTTFKTIQASVAYNAAGLVLYRHFFATNGTSSTTQVTPTTGGGGLHDWTILGGGMYAIEIPTASGDVNNTAEGFMWFTGVATGVLPWRGPIVGLRSALVNNSMISGTDTLQVDLTQVNGSVAAATNFEKAVSTITRGTVAAGSSTTVTNTSDLTEATNDHYKDKWLIFVTGANAGQGKQITGYNGTTKAITTGALTDAAATSDTFVIV